MAIELNGSLSDWTAADRLEKTGTAVAGHEVYGRFEGGTFYVAIRAPVAIGANTTLWLNTDRNSETGVQVFSTEVGAEYRVEFDATGTPKLINATSGGAALDVSFARSADGKTIELAISSSQLGGATGAITFAADINDGVFLPSSYAAGGYTIVDPASNPLDGRLDEWSHADRIDSPLTALTGFEVYGAAEGGVFQLALKAPSTIGNGTTFWLNTDNNTSTGTAIFGNPGTGGAEYRIEVDAGGIARLYTGSGTVPLATLNSMLGSDEASLELSIPKALVGNTSRLDIVLDVNNATYLPGNYSGPALTLVETPAAPALEAADRKIAIVYSATTAEHFFSSMAYSQLFMSAQSQAMAAGIPFDVISEDDLTDLAKLSQYDALVFPSFRNVPANYAAIQETLTRLVYDHDVSLIAAGDFMTNDAAGNALPDAYARMHLLLGLDRLGGSTGNVEVKVIAGTTAHPVTDDYAPGSTIHTYGSVGTSYYGAFNPAFTPATTIASQVFESTTRDAVVGTTTGGRNVHFATESLFGDSNLLGKALDWVTSTGTGPSVSLHMSRNSSLVASRNDMDQSQESYDVDGAGKGGVGIYDVLLPILEGWKEQYNFVGSYYVNVGVNPPDQDTNWLISKAYYDRWLAMGNEIGSHSYTHPSDTNFLVGAISTEAELDAFAALYAQAGNVDRDPAIASQLANMTLAQYQAALARGMAATNPATLNALDKAVLTTTFRFQFEKARQVLEEKLGVEIGGAAVPGMPESLATAREIIQYYQYLSGGASLVGAGYPNAFGYLSADEDARIYLAPNMSFDFTLLGWQNLTAEQAKAAWTAEWNNINESSDLPIVVWPWHDYGPTQWVIDPPNPSEYKLEMFTHFVEMAHASGAEFVTLADLAARMQAFEKSAFSFSVSGDLITARAVPDAGQIGTFALNLDDLGGKTIRSVSNWYAYDADSVFLDADGGEFQIQLGPAPDDVTHITSLDQRMKLVSLNGDGTNLNFTVQGEGIVKVALKDYLGNPFAVTGATVVSQVGDVLTLKLPTLGSHSVGVALTNAAPTAIGVSEQVAVLENTSSRTKVASVAVTDPDLDPRLRNNPVTVSDDRFVFDQADGGLYLQAGKTIDFETQSYIDLVLSTGSGAGAISKALQVAVTDVNEAPTGIVVSNQVALAENTNARTKIADLSVLDPDTNALFRDNLVTVNDTRFEATGGALYLKAGQSVDFETSPTIDLVLSTGSGASTVNQALQLTIADVNEAPTSIVVTNQVALAENTTARTKIADLMVVDPDASAAFRNNAVAVNDSRFEAVDGVLYLKPGQVIDFETSPTIDLVLSTGSGASTVNQALHLTIVDVNEAPTSILVSNQVPLAENTAVRTKIANISVLKPDSNPAFPNEAVVVNDSRFEVTQGALYLKAGQVIDYETNALINLVLSTGSGASAITKAVQLAIADVNEAPTGIVVSNQIALAENTTSRTKVADLSVLDPDTNAAFRNNAVVVNDSRFEVTQGALYLKAGQAIDYETQPYVNLTLSTDLIAKNIQLGIGNVNEAPTNIVVSNQITLPENTSVRTKVADLTVIDPDTTAGLRGNTLSVNDDRFEVSGGGLYLRAGQTIDYEATPTINLTVSAKDGSLSYSKALSINVGDVAEGLFAPVYNGFGVVAGGWSDDRKYHREVADVNGDNKADIVGFGAAGVYVALANAKGSFGATILALPAFGAISGGWSDDDRYPRRLADVNGDGKADIVGFGSAGVYISLANGAGGFGAVKHALGAFGASVGGWDSNDRYLREVADINGDGRADIVGFGAAGVYVSLADTLGGYKAPAFVLGSFGAVTGGWSDNNLYPRHLADVNGDDRADIVGFGAGGVYVALANGLGGFGATTMALAAFGPAVGGWTDNEKYPRVLADVNGDGKDDIVGFGEVGTYVSLASTQGGHLHFESPTFEIPYFGKGGAGGGWSGNNQMPRLLADIDGDHRADVVGFGSDGVHIAEANDWFI